MIFKSPHPSVTIPEISLTDYVLRHADELGEKPALIDGPSGRTFSYGQLRGYVTRLAAGFAAHGVTKGEVFAIYSSNIHEYALAFHAVASLGEETTMVSLILRAEVIIKQLHFAHGHVMLLIQLYIAKSI